MAPIHNRMPVILGPTDFAAWLEQATPANDVVAMLHPDPAEPMEAYPVSTLVNFPRNQGPGRIAREA